MAARPAFADAVVVVTSSGRRASSTAARERKPRRVLVVDDDAGFRALARTLLACRGYQVVAEASDGEQALAQARRLRPDAALVDVQLPSVDGVALTRQLVEAAPGLRIVLTSTDAAIVPRAVLARSAALAFVAKDELAVTDLGSWLDR
jgi:DNA-binding NarL/FixJ family response regulator